MCGGWGQVEGAALELGEGPGDGQPQAGALGGPGLLPPVTTSDPVQPGLSQPYCVKFS